jgi:hypothetical protein
MKQRMFGSAMGALTVAQEGDGWVVLEDGRRVGGTLLVPFASRKAAQRYVKKELAAEAEAIASGDVAGSATARAIRDLDAEVWDRKRICRQRRSHEGSRTQSGRHEHRHDPDLHGPPRGRRKDLPDRGNARRKPRVRRQGTLSALAASPVVKIQASRIYCRRNRVSKNRRATAMKRRMDG